MKLATVLAALTVIALPALSIANEAPSDRTAVDHPVPALQPSQTQPSPSDEVLHYLLAQEHAAREQDLIGQHGQVVALSAQVTALTKERDALKADVVARDKTIEELKGVTHPAQKLEN